jgi:hypothetical protein
MIVRQDEVNQEWQPIRIAKRRLETFENNVVLQMCELVKGCYFDQDQVQYQLDKLVAHYRDQGQDLLDKYNMFLDISLPSSVVPCSIKSKFNLIMMKSRKMAQIDAVERSFVERDVDLLDE